jgi:flagellin-like protein
MESGEIGWRIRYRILAPYIRTTPKNNLINDFTQLLNEMMRHRSRSVGLSPLVAVILLIAITVAAAVVVSGVFFSLSGAAANRPSVQIDNIRLVATSGGVGTWVVSIKNAGNLNVTAITASATATYFPDGCQPTAALSFTPVRPAPGQVATSTASTSGTGTGACAIGTFYRIRIDVTFADGSTQTLLARVRAEAF